MRFEYESECTTLGIEIALVLQMMIVASIMKADSVAELCFRYMTTDKELYLGRRAWQWAPAAVRQEWHSIVGGALGTEGEVDASSPSGIVATSDAADQTILEQEDVAISLTELASAS